MKWIIYIGLLLLAGVLPTNGTDVGKLIPVEVVAVSEREGTIIIEADTGDLGTGRTISEAVSDMEESASGIIYLDTAEYLILQEGTHTEELRKYLKGDVHVCQGDGITLEGIAAFLSIHKPVPRLDEITEKTELPAITEENGRYKLLEK